MKTRTINPRIAAALVLLGLAGCGVAPRTGEPRPAIPAVDDAALLKLFEIGDFKLPPRLFTPALVERLRQGKPTFLTAGYIGFFRHAELGKRVAEQIPEARWRELIPPYAAFTARCNQRPAESGVCPFCGKPYGGPVMTLEDFFKGTWDGASSPPRRQ